MRPLTIEEVQTTTDLLTEVFATLGGAGWTVYTRYMRNQIRKFLEVAFFRQGSAFVLGCWSCAAVQSVIRAPMFDSVQWRLCNGGMRHCG